MGRGTDGRCGFRLNVRILEQAHLELKPEHAGHGSVDGGFWYLALAHGGYEVAVGLCSEVNIDARVEGHGACFAA